MAFSTAVGPLVRELREAGAQNLCTVVHRHHQIQMRTQGVALIFDAGLKREGEIAMRINHPDASERKSKHETLQRKDRPAAGNPGFEDRRPDAAMQRQIAEMAQDSPRTKQLQRGSAPQTMPPVQRKGKAPDNDKVGQQHEAYVMQAHAISTGAHSLARRQSASVSAMPLQAYAWRQGGSPIQLQTEIKHTTNTIPFGGSHYLVGVGMTALLDPADPIAGSATTSDNYDWMKGIRAYYPAAGVIRGHLLNHDLGGYGVPENLYPISSMANSQHSDRVEQNVKGALTESAGDTKNRIEYSVDVAQYGSGNTPYERAAFHCRWTEQDGTVHTDVIDSDLNVDKGWGGKSASAKKSPYAWRHGSRRGEENMSTVMAHNRIQIDSSAFAHFTPLDMANLKARTLSSSGISDVQDWAEALSMLKNELDELATVADPADPPDALTAGAAYVVDLKNGIDAATHANTLDAFTGAQGPKMMENLIAIRKARLYLQDGSDVELNIADKSGDVTAW